MQRTNPYARSIRRAVLIVAALVAQTAFAQSYPSKPIRFIIPFAPETKGEVLPQ
jgi:tripartite-type tricarboxylate transporter receptor subunit TctC